MARRLEPDLVKVKVTRGECYANCLDTMLANRLAGRDLSDWRVVHGIVHGQGPLAGRKIGHAWMENEGMVYDPSSDAYMPRAVYYLAGKPDNVVRYDWEEVAKLTLRHKHSGPWDARLLAFGGETNSKEGA